MSKYVNVPHLPEGKVGLIAIGERYRERLGRALDARGIGYLAAGCAGR